MNLHSAFTFFSQGLEKQADFNIGDTLGSLKDRWNSLDPTAQQGLRTLGGAAVGGLGGALLGGRGNRLLPGLLGLLTGGAAGYFWPKQREPEPKQQGPNPWDTPPLYKPFSDERAPFTQPGPKKRGDDPYNLRSPGEPIDFLTTTDLVNEDPMSLTLPRYSQHGVPLHSL